jgi:hypothetical protein
MVRAGFQIEDDRPAAGAASAPSATSRGGSSAGINGCAWAPSWLPMPGPSPRCSRCLSEKRWGVFIGSLHSGHGERQDGLHLRSRRIKASAPVAGPGLIESRNRFASPRWRRPRKWPCWPTSRRREVPRTPTGIDELDRVLGGGIVEGGVILIGGDPGHRQVDAAAAGAGRAAARRRARPSTSPARKAAPRWRCARGGWAWSSRR